MVQALLEKEEVLEEDEAEAEGVLSELASAFDPRCRSLMENLQRICVCRGLNPCSPFSSCVVLYSNISLHNCNSNSHDLVTLLNFRESLLEHVDL